MRKVLLAGLALVMGAAGSVAEVKPANLFSDHAVLRAGMAVPVWGTADAGRESDGDGEWGERSGEGGGGWAVDGPAEEAEGGWAV